MKSYPVFDFHTHTFHSDGVLSPIELIRRAHVLGYQVIGLTDHVGEGELEWLMEIIAKNCELASSRWDILALPGVELTHVPAEDIDRLAERAKQLGATIVVVHGETPVEPVVPETNRAAVTSPHVDILAHPGMLTLEEAQLARDNDVLLEISGRCGHSFTNGHVARIAEEAGAKLLVNSDAHQPGNLLTPEMAMKIALGSGLTPDESLCVLQDNPRALLRRLGVRT
jgi:histidinol phosphatase-like PHP family hydrolase